MNAGLVYTFAVVVLAVVFAFWIIPPTGSLAVKCGG